MPGRDGVENYARQMGLPGTSPPGTASRPRDWNDNVLPDVRQLRHDYLHVSFRVELGMGVRIATLPGTTPPHARPHRLVYHG